ncbi:helix-turn-helix domain-containing protein [Limosilactobacillus reuteri]|uniref:helix-turn-helix domain-containing protein n=1 Tax=Limosilactobacillus reuteri TaxID=1598 RepID=UPI001E2CEFE0|nr:helix-turn-helix transcriptional regulator [Limosilactobacillus reuteri]MCC4501820.1 helix-turn-helix domain-containing protein [Limosilactobacillus reuteri]
MTLGQNIHKLRINQNLTQEQLAELCSLTVNFISRIERDKTNRVSVFTVQKIAKALNTTIDDLLNDDDDNAKANKQVKPNQQLLNNELNKLDDAKSEKLSKLFLQILKTK